MRFVRNLTDVDDKIIARAAEHGESPDALAERSIAALSREMDALGVLPPDVEPRVTRHVPEIVALIERLVASGHAYPAGGDVYFAVASFPAYGALSRQAVADLVAGARVEPGEGKRSPEDFALWKAAKAGEPSWPSPWGAGRPGWHIECSAMALAHLGPSFDLHGGGVDLVFPHHENEIAQSQAALGPGTFARRWLHNGMLEVSGSKMGKSLGNFRYVADVRERYGAEAVRFFLVSHHPRAAVAFEEGADGLPGVAEADRRLAYLYATLARVDAAVPASREAGPGAVVPAAERFLAAFDAALDDDLNTPLAVAEVGSTSPGPRRSRSGCARSPGSPATCGRPRRRSSESFTAIRKSSSRSVARAWRRPAGSTPRRWLACSSSATLRGGRGTSLAPTPCATASRRWASR